MISEIQLKILTILLHSKGLPYSKARPSGIENDLYNYHLQFLVSKGFIDKNDKIYSLSNKGKKFILNIDSKGTLKDLFRISVLPYIVRSINDKKEFLAHKRTRQPYLGDIESVAGKVHRGERIEDAALRKLKEETGLIAKLKLIGVHRKIRRDKHRNLIEDTFYHVLYGEDPTGDLILKNEFGENFWIDFPSLYKMQEKNITASKVTEDVLNRIYNNDLTFFYYQEDIIINRF